ncbi:hypothetical protein [Thauera linaloolentis]|uniref:Uncharacterized protein n=1 Tax=Thauera linaloolentis (strain DSM 12138 / JCM 21573 / CCUG 41526 / CIP 105981 / IAM 15112 / NBRC 102519 / 47Lol) TaxID=1123367 RepID=N6Z5Y4_THAL4|nr:hypothetical protein [Thauera linaloolentis]ENO89932.1 hypothetical protein C666_03565 [Thauera linaloolentis 47Lol = DSM 12138]MCM8566641.1 hypothetical protein [Thauera linaloolentis]
MSSANPGLAYEDTPPLSAPLRFFLTAPLFGLCAGLVLLLGDGVLSSRWTPGALAAVHLFAAGFMLQVMIGALQQILPVVAGVRFPAALGVAGSSHALLTLGAMGLAGGLAFGRPDAIIGGAVLLLGGIGIFLVAALAGLIRSPSVKIASHAPRDLRLAMAGLAVTAVLGVALALAIGRGVVLPLPLPQAVDLHATWGWLGWGGILLAATSWVVVPMFQITPGYPARFTRWWGPGVLAGLVSWSLARALGADGASSVLGVTLVLGFAAFALLTLRLQSRTRRSTPDAPFRAFRMAMLAILAGLAALSCNLADDAEHWSVLAGVLILHGGFGGAISAMLYKIVPFLAWLHLTQAGIRAPNMKKLLPDTPVRRQLALHLAVLAALVLGVFADSIARIAGLLMITEFGWLLLNMLRVLHNLKRARHT